jgi:DNA polymerase-3 subunit epsilon
MTHTNDINGMERTTGRELSLERPLAVIDTESTGLNPDTARIVRISVLRLELDGRKTLRSELVNPGIPIPRGATAVHGITDDDVAGKPPFRAYARALAQALQDCDLAGFAVERYHLPLLLAEFRRAGVEFSMENRAVIDVMSIYHRLEPRDFESAYLLYTGNEKPPDRASGTRSQATLEILFGQLSSNVEVPNEPHRLVRWARGVPYSVADEEGRFTHLDSGELAFNFGKHAGETVARVVESDPSYVAWVASYDSFSPESRKIAAQALSDAGYEPSNGNS